MAKPSSSLPYSPNKKELNISTAEGLFSIIDSNVDNDVAYGDWIGLINFVKQTLEPRLNEYMLHVNDGEKLMKRGTMDELDKKDYTKYKALSDELKKLIPYILKNIVPLAQKTEIDTFLKDIDPTKGLLVNMADERERKNHESRVKDLAAQYATKHAKAKMDMNPLFSKLLTGTDKQYALEAYISTYTRVRPTIAGRKSLKKLRKSSKTVRKSRRHSNKK